MMQGASHLLEEANMMDGMALYELGRVLYEDRLRDAQQRRRLWRSPRFSRMPRLVQLVLAALS